MATLEQLEEISKAGYGDNYDKIGRLFACVGVETDGTKEGTVFKREFTQEETIGGEVIKRVYVPKYPFDEDAAFAKMEELGLIK